MDSNGFKFRAPTPYIFFDYLEPSRWINIPIKEIVKVAEKLRKQVKDGMDYFWDNQHFIITDIYGKPALTVGFFEEDISFWNAVTGDGLYSCYGEVFTEENYNFIQEAIENISKRDRRYCSSCGKWVNTGFNYSFAGFVCEDCYDPDVHQAPDTSGD
ncbi:MAG: hypothetical protein QHH15_00445 [Candidatus Thermoplasmatota archaeon]|nr:hypothetical protein [Candidatus Thermoplasmatota archaeon]MDH7506243.1 hypothetical protein [Candidatus Thermoplasmatota archaeon]